MVKRIWPWVAGTAAGLILVKVVWWLGSPLFLDRMVNEPVPGTRTRGAIYTGMFRDGDASHHATGLVRTVEADGVQYLRFEGFEATNGPDLYVYLATPGAPVTEGIHLGKLKGNIGPQNYELPPGADLMKNSRVVIWCKAFGVTFGTADLKAGDLTP